MEYLHWVYSRYGSQVSVEAERGVIQSVTSLVSPYFDGQERDEERPVGVWTIRARQNATIVRVPSHGPDRLSYHEPFVSIALEEKVIHVEETHNTLVVQRILRLLRDLIRLQLEATSVFVHGGMIELAGTGVAFLGPQQSGKTSSLLAILAQSPATFVDNDALSLHSCGNTSYGLGWPRAINIRRDTLAALETVLPEKRPERLFGNQAQKETGSLSPSEFAHTFGCSLSPQAELHLIVFPSFLPRGEHSTFSLLPMTKEDALSTLEEYLLPVPSTYHHFLRPYFPQSADHTLGRHQRIEQLVQHVPCYRLQQSFSAIVTAARAVIALAQGNKRCF